VIVLEAWSPVGSLEKGLHGAGQVHEPIAHQEEHAAKPNILKLEIVKLPICHPFKPADI
jgi:hypothetical protein